jgi:serine/threonine protein kinase
MRTSRPANDQQVVLYNPAARKVAPGSDCLGSGSGDVSDFRIREASVRDSYKVLPIVIGTGSFGTVRACIHRQSRTYLAMKSVNVNGGNSGNVELLRNEISVLRRVNHPHVVRMLDVMRDRDYVHIVMEHYRGKDLFDLIVGSRTPLSEGTGRRIVASLLDAVAYLHERNIVHRDLKVSGAGGFSPPPPPSNIIPRPLIRIICRKIIITSRPIT